MSNKNNTVKGYESYTHDYILLVIILALTGFMSFFGLNHGIFYFAPYILVLFVGRNCHFSRLTKIVLCALAFLFFIQARVHGGATINAISFLLKFVLMALCACILASNFYKTFPKTMYIICIVSLFFWFLTNFFPFIRSICIDIAQSLPELRSKEFLLTTTNDSYSLYIYTLPKIQGVISRNSGPFFEPGMFTVFITTALAINVFKSKRFYNKQNLVLFITNITTFSTTGYLAMMLLIAGFVIVNNENIFVKFFLSTILLVFALTVFSLDFMQEKILTQMDESSNAWSRFGALFYHWEKIRLAPLTGYGINDLPLTGMDTGLELLVSPNGISWVGVLFGLPGAFFYFVFLFLSTRTMIKTNSSPLAQIIMFMVIMTLIFSQDVTGRLFFFMLIFMGIESLRKAPQYATSKQ